jgi:hypothetical protein
MNDCSPVRKNNMIPKMQSHFFDYQSDEENEQNTSQYKKTVDKIYKIKRAVSGKSPSQKFINTTLLSLIQKDNCSSS